MLDRRCLLALLLVVPLLAGCTSHTKQPGTTAPTTAPTSSQSSTTMHGQSFTNSTVFAGMQLSQCTGFYGGTPATPKQTTAGQAPPGWEPTNPNNEFVNLHIGGAECNRIHVGPYERGPIRMVWDGHINADIPAGCTVNQTATTHPTILNAFLINDAEIADYLRTTYGMPTFYADIQTEAQAAGALVQRTWTWAAAGHPASRLNVYDDGTNQSYDFVDRIWWQAGDGIGQLDFAYERWAFSVGDRAGEGTMQAPMLALSPDGSWIGAMEYFPSMSGKGTFTLYTDYLCQHPRVGP